MGVTGKKANILFTLVGPLQRSESERNTKGRKGDERMEVHEGVHPR